MLTHVSRRTVTKAVLLGLALLELSTAFTGPIRTSDNRCRSLLSQHTLLRVSTDTATMTMESSPSASKKELSRTLTVTAAKQELLNLLPRMTGQDHEFRRVEQLVNTLEDQYQQAQTLPFLNFAMQGDWQLLFSTNLVGSPNPGKFRLREQFQRAECDGLGGTLTTEATWDLAQQEPGIFDVSGTFSVTCSYKINQGARMIVQPPNHTLKLSPGSALPEDAQALVGLLHRSMPKELFDPSDHGIDPTFLDADMKIVRYTGPRLEGVRDIFVRRGAVSIDPSLQ